MIETGERIIVSLTSYGERLKNLPTVLDTIMCQTLRPDCVVLNLAHEEQLPSALEEYILRHDIIETFRVPDTKVYKKIIPTLQRYPDDCIISIDDDWLYSKEMIEDFVQVHLRHPDNPVSGNNFVYFGMPCHCGASSLVKATHFGDYLEAVDDDLRAHCKSSDLVYTYFATKAGHPYVRTTRQYSENMTPFNDVVPYSNPKEMQDRLKETLQYLTDRFGPVPETIEMYVRDEEMARLVAAICENRVGEAQRAIMNSKQYRIGRALLSPFHAVKRIILPNRKK